MKKRLFAGLLTLVMIVSLVPMTALAAGDATQTTEAEASVTYSIGTSGNGTDSYSDCATGWAAAVAYSVKNSSPVKVVLLSDWEAEEGGTFGSGSDAFHEGALYVPSRANIVLDLNGKKLDRGLNAESATQYGNVIYVEGALTVEDNDSSNTTHTITNPGYDSSAENATESKKVEITGGLITGGYVNGGTDALDETNIYDGIYGGAGILVYRGTLTLNGGTIAGNSVISHLKGHNGGGGVFVYGDKDGAGTFTMNDGTISYNYVAQNSEDGAKTSGVGGGGVLAGTINYIEYPLTETAYYTTFTMKGGKIENNVVSGGWGGGVYSGYAKVDLSAGSISNNVNNSTSSSGGGVCAGRSTKLTVGSSADSKTSASANSLTIANNTASSLGGGIYLTSSPNAETTATINSGSISDNNATNEKSDGGGIALNNGAKVEMTGGKISDNQAVRNGGGVYLNGTSEFTISGGEISGNTANSGGGIFTAAKAALLGNGKLSGNVATNTGYSGGGGVCVSGSAAEFTMSGGTIDGTLAESSQYGVNASKGGGVFVAGNTKFTLTGGNIINNTASAKGGGVYVNNNGTFIMSGGKIGGKEDDGNTASSTSENVHGGGVYSEGTVTMNGGEISYNKATTSGTGKIAYGGGVCASGANSTFTMSGTAKVSNNSATSTGTLTLGGGVCVTGQATFTMESGAVTENTVSSSSTGTSFGAGVCVNNNTNNNTNNKTSTFTMTGGTISGNCLSSSGNGNVYGGGVGLREPLVEFTMRGGTITGNTATNGGGVYVYNKEGSTFSVSGNPTITGNIGKNRAANNVYLANITSNGSSTMKTITLDGNLTGGIIGVTTATKLPSSDTGTAVQITTAESVSEGESESGYYEKSYAYFVPDAGSNVKAQKNENGKYVEFAYTSETSYTVTITGNNMSYTSSGATVMENGTYTATINADPGYVLMSVKVGDDEENINAQATSHELTISNVQSNQTVNVTTKADSVKASPTSTETTISGTYGKEIEEVNLSNVITAKYSVSEEKAEIISYSTDDLSEYGLTLSVDGKITGTPTKATEENSTITITVTVKALNGTTADVELPITIDKATLDAPKFTAAATSKTEITITWPTWPDGAESISYTVADASGTEVSTGTVTNGQSTTKITGLTAGTTYTITANYVPDNSGNYKAADTEATQTVTTTANGSNNSSSSSSGYSVNIPGTKNGTVTATPRSASKNDTVTLTVKPNSGYELADLTVTDAKGNELKLTDKGDGKYTFTMPASKVTILASFKEQAAAHDCPSEKFTDVDTTQYYHEAVDWAVLNGVTVGTSATAFSPNASCTRAQTVTFLWRAAGSPAPKSSVNPFTDVLPGAYYYDAVLWAVEKGITVGTSATTFSPDLVCTRAQCVTFLYRYGGSSTSGSNPFSDVEDGAYYYDAVLWAVENGVTVGTSATTFSPDDSCSRAQIVTFLYRAYA